MTANYADFGVAGEGEGQQNHDEPAAGSKSRWLAARSFQLAFLIAAAWAPSARSATITDLGTLGGSFSLATGINASGQVVGYSTTAGNAAEHAFLYSGGVMTDLGTFGGNTSVANGINDSGQVVGYSSTAGNAATHAFLYSGGSMTDLGTLGGTFSSAVGINASGQVVGGSQTADNVALAHAFLYSGGIMTDLGTLGGSYSFAEGINATGQVVGNWNTAGGQPGAFLYSGGSMTDLNSLLPTGSGWQLVGANAINDSGQIVGDGIINGAPHAFLLDTRANSSAPEPASLALLVPGAAFLVLMRKKLQPSL